MGARKHAVWMLGTLLWSCGGDPAMAVQGGTSSGAGSIGSSGVSSGETSAGTTSETNSSSGMPATTADTSTSTNTSTGDEASSSSGDASWRSSLYPSDWTPGFRDALDRGVQDFSYAGYRQGEPLPTRFDHPVLDVTEFGADPSGVSPSDGAVTAALDSVVGAAVLHFPAGDYSFEQTIDIERDDVVLQGEGPEATFLRFTRSDAMSYRGHIEARSTIVEGPDRLLTSDAQRGAFEIEVASTQDFAVGDDVALGWVITEDFIAEHGMSGTWDNRLGLWKPFFRANIVALDDDSITLDVPIRSDVLMRDGASIRAQSGYVHGVGLESFSVSNVVSDDVAWAGNQVAAIRLEGVVDSWVRDVQSYAPPGETFHLQSKGVVVISSKRVTVRDSIMSDPQHRGEGGNGYLFEVSQSNEVLFSDVAAYRGRHNLIQNWDFGTSGCVFLRCHSEDSVAYFNQNLPSPIPAYSEFHHSLAMANLIDDCTLLDGWLATNRGSWSTGAGITAVENVFWNPHGGGTITTKQHGWGYVVSDGDVHVRSDLMRFEFFDQTASAPEDFIEEVPEGLTLDPPSLYEDQRARRLGRRAEPPSGRDL